VSRRSSSFVAEESSSVLFVLFVEVSVYDVPPIVWFRSSFFMLTVKNRDSMIYFKTSGVGEMHFREKLTSTSPNLSTSET